MKIADAKLFTVLIPLCAVLGAGNLAGQTESTSLLGSWELHLWVTGPASTSAGPRSARGRLELGPLDVDALSPARSNGYSVSYDSSLTAMFGPPRSGPAQAMRKLRGKVELVFNPLIDHGTFVLTGVVHGDSITGQWHRINFANDGYRGAFTMVRR